MVRIVKKSKERISEIVLAACHLFQAKGYDKVSMQDVMDTVGIAKGTIYHYFKSKEELFEAVVEHIVNTNIEHMRFIMQGATGNALDNIKMLIVAGNISTDNTMILEALHKHKNDTMHARLLAAMVTKQAIVYAQVIHQGCQEGTFQTNHPREVAEFILSAIQFLTDVGIYPWTHQDIERRAHAFPTIIECLLKAPKGSFNFLLNIFIPKEDQ